MKNRFLVGLVLVVFGLLASGAPVSAQIGNNLGDYQGQIVKRNSLTCDLDASVVLVSNTVQNDLTFSLDYESDEYVKQGATFEVIATGKNNVVLYEKSGNFNLNGSGRVAVSGESSGPNGTTFRFNAKDHGEVKLTAKVDGKICPEVKIQAKTNFSAQALINASNDPDELILNNNFRVSSTVVIIPEGMRNATSSTTSTASSRNNVPEEDNSQEDGGEEDIIHHPDNVTINNNDTDIFPRNEEGTQVSDEAQSPRDYILYGLLGALLVVMIAYIVMKKRGSI